MRKLMLATTGLLALATGSAVDAADVFAADLAKPLLKAPPPPLPSNWTGCYLGAGGGYGMWNQDTFAVANGAAFTATQTGGGRGSFGTVQIGCDYQFANSWLIGAFADWDFGSIKGTPSFPVGLVGDEKLTWSWTVGGRIGYLVMPQLLTYAAAGYTEARFDQANLSAGLFLPAHTYHGWFVGTGYEYALAVLPGLFWKTEYRYADYQSDLLPELFTLTGLPNGTSIDSHKFVQTVRTELVWRFNWNSPVIAKY
jgi:outer membrane immunogenic protein